MRQVSPPPIGRASLPKRALSANATCPAGMTGMDAVVLLKFGLCDCDCCGGTDGTAKLLGPKMSLRVAGIGEISPVEGVAEKSEFCARACFTAAHGITAAATSGSASRTRPRRKEVAIFITPMFSAEIGAISSQLQACL